jgi:hypothetical protein
MKNKNIIAVQNLIRCLDIESLRNFEVVANLVRAFGIMNWGPNATGPEMRFINYSGAAIGQTPDQIAKALVYISRFEINSFCEIGLYYGGNFLFCSEYLRRFNPDIQCTGIDPSDYLDSEIKEIINANDWLYYEKTTSESLTGRQFDFVFIDGEHTAPWPAKDYENIGRHAKICGFHDLQDPLWQDVRKFWGTLNNPGMRKVEFLDDLSGRNSHGIGLIHDEIIRYLHPIESNYRY